MDIQEKLRVLMRIGLSEKAIANAVQVHQSTISRILSGKIKQPKISLVSAIIRLMENEVEKQKFA